MPENAIVAVRVSDLWVVPAQWNTVFVQVCLSVCALSWFLEVFSKTIRPISLHIRNKASLVRHKTLLCAIIL